MSLRLLRGLADDRDIQAPADHLSDFAERHPLIGDGVIPGYDGAALQYETVKNSGINPVHGGPTVEPFPYVRRHAFFPRYANKERHKSMIADAVNGGGKRNTDTRAPLSEADAAASSDFRGNVEFAASCSVAGRPGAVNAVPEVT